MAVYDMAIYDLEVYDMQVRGIQVRDLNIARSTFSARLRDTRSKNVVMQLTSPVVTRGAGVAVGDRLARAENSLPHEDSPFAA